MARSMLLIAQSASGSRSDSSKLCSPAMHERGQARHADQLLTVKTAVSLIFGCACQELEARRMVSRIVRQTEASSSDEMLCQGRDERKEQEVKCPTR